MKYKKSYIVKLLIAIIILVLILSIVVSSNVFKLVKQEENEKQALDIITGFNSISAGTYTSMTIDSNGKLWTWGFNNKGQLGNGGTNITRQPRKIEKSKSFSKVVATMYHTLAIDASENLWAWGDNSSGQLGNGTTTDVTSPIQIKSGTKFKDISVGMNNSYAIDTSGNLWSWGSNYTGELGNGTTTDVTSPIQIKSGTSFTKISSGSQHCLAIDSNGNLWSWGANYCGQLGNGKYYNEGYKGYETSPIQIKSGTQFKEISAGDKYSMAIDIEGNLWFFGLLDSTKVNSTLSNIAEVSIITPIQVTNSKKTKFAKVAAGTRHCFAIDTSGNLWAWGVNSSGQLGNGATTDVTSPIQIKSGTQFKEVSAGNDHSMAIDIDGNLWTSGGNYNGQLGTLATEDSNVFIQIPQIMVNLDNQSATTDGDRSTTATFGAEMPTITLPEKTGYIFAGYYTETNGNGIQYYNSDGTGTRKWNVMERTTLYAKWEPATNTPYKIEYYKQNTSLNSYELDKTENKTGTTGETVTATPITYIGFKENITHSSRKAEGVISEYGTLTLKLYYDRETYKVTLYKDGGTINSGNITSYAYGVGARLPIPTKSGYTFAGWYTNSSFTGNPVTTITTSETGAKTYYAKWTQNEFTVTFNTNGGSTIAPVKVLANNTVNQPTNPTKASTNSINYTFEGWYTNTECTTKYNFSTPVTQDITLYAKYTQTPRKYTVTFKDGNKQESQEIEYGGSSVIPNWTKPGYILTWDKPTSNITNNVTINAVWTAREDTAYKVEHYVRNLDIEVEGYELRETEEKTGTTDTTATAVYKEYEGFTKDENNSRNVKTGNIAGDGSLVLKLYYSRNTYNITYELNGGAESSPLTSKYTYGREMILQINRVTKQGYEFAGWYDNEELTGNPVTTIPATSTGNKTFYAKWTKNIFTVTFKDGTERTDVQTINKGESATPPNWTKPGYDLSWSKDITNITNDLEVEAIWTAKTDTPYKVIHHFRNLDTEVEGYIDEEEPKTGTTDSVVTAEYKTRKGFEKNESHRNKVETGTVAGNGSLVLHLYYTRNTYNITYELNGGAESSPLTSKYTYGREMILQINRVTKQGYEFAGWYDNEELTGNPVTTIPATSTGNKTFYAKWVEAEKEYYILSEIYNIDLTENIITKVSPETMSAEFLSKIDTNGQMKVVNAQGEEITDTSLVGTGYKLQVTFKGKVHTYEIAVRGDIDGNGKLTITDLSMLNQVLLKKVTLTGIKEKAADINYIGGITITDLSMLNQALMKKITL